MSDSSAGTLLSYEPRDLRFLGDPAYQGAEFEARIRVTVGTCVADYDVQGLSPAVSCETESGVRSLPHPALFRNPQRPRSGLLLRPMDSGGDGVPGKHRGVLPEEAVPQPEVGALLLPGPGRPHPEQSLEVRAAGGGGVRPCAWLEAAN